MLTVDHGHLNVWELFVKGADELHAFYVVAEDEQIFYGVEVEKFVEFGMFVFGADWGEDVFW